MGKWEGVVDANACGVKVSGHEGKAGCEALLMRHEKLQVDSKGLLR